MSYQTRVMQKGDKPEHITLLHEDGSLTDVEVRHTDDIAEIVIKAPKGKEFSIQHSGGVFLAGGKL